MTKKTLFYLVLLSSFMIISCSDDDGDSQTPQNDNNYFPLVVNNSWDYQNTVSSPNQDDIVDQETLTVEGTAQVGGNTVYEFGTSNLINAAPTTLALSNGVLYKMSSSLIYTGSFGLGLPEFPDVNFEVQDGEIYDKNANEDTVLFSFSDTLDETIEDVPITIDYTISSIMGSRFESIEVNNQTYENVISSKLVIDLEITADIGITVPVLNEQRVVEVTNYFAKDIGLIQSETDTSFDFLTLPSLPFEDFSFFTLQEIEDFSVSLE